MSSPFLEKMIQKKHTTGLLDYVAGKAKNLCWNEHQQALNTPLEDITNYRQLVGKLLYPTNSRPDVAYAVHKLSEHLDKPTSYHLTAAHRVLRFLKNSPGRGLFFPSNNSLKLQGFTDSDWATSAITRKSITGFCVFIGSALISWRSKKQSTVAKSSSEAEYRAIALTICELQFLYLLQDLQISHEGSALMFWNNQSAIRIAKNLFFHEFTKHIEINCHFIREKLKLGPIHLLPISSANQIADVTSMQLVHFPSLVC